MSRNQIIHTRGVCLKPDGFIGKCKKDPDNKMISYYIIRFELDDMMILRTVCPNRDFEDL